MSYKHGIAAINLEMTDRVPRLEFSAPEYWELVNRVCKTNVTPSSEREEKRAASIQFMHEWNFDINWYVRFGKDIFGEYCTSMGHAAYASGGVDFVDDRGSYFKTAEDVLKFDFYKTIGKKDENEILSVFNKNYEFLQSRYTDMVNTTGMYTTAMSGAIDLFGWDLLLEAAGVDPEGFGQVMIRYTDWVKQYFDALSKCDAPIIMVHDDMVWTSGPFIHPDWYRKFLFPSYKKLFAPILEKGKKILYTCDGDFTTFIDDVANCGVHGFITEPITDSKYIAEKYGKTHVFMGNGDTNVLLRGTKEDIYNEVKRCMDIGKNCPGFFMLVGNHIPSNTPIDNCLYYNEAYEKLSKR